MNELSKRFSVNGVDLAWQDWGEGEPFVLCHGFSGSAHDFDLNVEALAERRRVVALDHRGHGRSTKLATTDGYSIAQLAADLIALIDANVDAPVDLLGHSMGGRIALELALSRPDLVRSLVLMDTSAWSFVSPDPETRAMIEGFMASFDPADGLPKMPPGPEDELIARSTPTAWQEVKDRLSAGFDPYALSALGRELFGPGISVRDRLGDIACPVTVIVGSLDRPFVDQAPELAGEVKDGEHVIIDGAYHSPQLTHGDEWHRAVEAHLARR
ncbi:MAG TPA: alpha/beta hydrolase [Acidimicrobiales bacterium]|nr:alpha/beta hydrolase [Acidimicrobiales bacterium]